ncbi:MAG: hypothetical protein J1E42_01345 [Akkermansiaceae bacterium]|nr:hypothetical protein [Akkermansiaceae bacterium]
MRKWLLIIVAVVALLGAAGGAAYVWQDDLHEFRLSRCSSLAPESLPDDAELARLSAKVVAYYNPNGVKPEQMQPMLVMALLDASNSRRMADAFYRLWKQQHDSDKGRYYYTSRELATAWMLRAAQMGDVVACLIVQLQDEALFPLEGVHNPELAKKALDTLLAQPTLSARHCAVAAACYRAGVGTPVDEAKAAEFQERCNRLLRGE